MSKRTAIILDVALIGGGAEGLDTSCTETIQPSPFATEIPHRFRQI